VKQPKPILHGRDHEHGSPDVVLIVWENVGAPLSSGRQPLILTGLPTADPGVAGAVWNDAGTLKISAG
jgi:hypothetical protein